jgi:hypothetical protein
MGCNCGSKNKRQEPPRTTAANQPSGKTLATPTPAAAPASSTKEAGK